MRLFEGYGIELEFMVVNAETLDVLPVSDKILRAAAGRYTNEYDGGSIGWSNELVLHLIELKNNVPVPSLAGLSAAFQEQVTRINDILAGMDGRLMPSGMHPWMDPGREAELWPRRNHRIYETYDRIFNCKRHGWTNLQSMHLNISFSGDEEFCRLHAAVRLVLPLIPALAAGSPVADCRITGIQDTRLMHYMNNQRKIRSISGSVIPEPVFSRGEYNEKIFARMYRDIAEYDKEGALQHEWLNSRGAIPRYERSALEIRVIDTQECTEMNIAVAGMVLSVLKQLVSEKWTSVIEQKSWKVRPLVSIFRDTVKKGEEAVIDNASYLRMFGFPGPEARADELWAFLAEESANTGVLDKGSVKTVKFILEKGTLSRRILRALGKRPSRMRMKEVYGRLCSCLSGNELFPG